MMIFIFVLPTSILNGSMSETRHAAILFMLPALDEGSIEGPSGMRGQLTLARISAQAVYNGHGNASVTQTD